LEKVKEPSTLRNRGKKRRAFSASMKKKSDHRRSAKKKKKKYTKETAKNGNPEVVLKKKKESKVRQHMDKEKERSAPGVRGGKNKTANEGRARGESKAPMPSGRRKYKPFEENLGEPDDKKGGQKQRKSRKKGVSPGGIKSLVGGNDEVGGCFKRTTKGKSEAIRQKKKGNYHA